MGCEGDTSVLWDSRCVPTEVMLWWRNLLIFNSQAALKESVFTMNSIILLLFRLIECVISQSIFKHILINWIWVKKNSKMQF